MTVKINLHVKSKEVKNFKLYEYVFKTIEVSIKYISFKYLFQPEKNKSIPTKEYKKGILLNVIAGYGE